jgi:hypothetical protein
MPILWCYEALEVEVVATHCQEWEDVVGVYCGQ